MADSSFDVVSKVDHQEVDNALNQTGRKELSQRFDFKNTGAHHRLVRRGKNPNEASTPRNGSAPILDVSRRN